ncbi:hypothetical protein P7C70_g6403, partial [Phenoliferia sp. Uapishka_3]
MPAVKRKEPTEGTRRSTRTAPTEGAPTLAAAVAVKKVAVAPKAKKAAVASVEPEAEKEEEEEKVEEPEAKKAKKEAPAPKKVVSGVTNVGEVVKDVTLKNDSLSSKLFRKSVKLVDSNSELQISDPDTSLHDCFTWNTILSI